MRRLRIALISLMFLVNALPTKSDGMVRRRSAAQNMTASSSSNSVFEGLTICYDLNEESGNRADAVGTGCGGSGCELTDVNSVGFGDGVIGNASKHISNGQEYFTHADHADLSINGDMTFSVFYCPDDDSQNDVIFSQRNTFYEYFLALITGSPKLFKFSVGSASGSAAAEIDMGSGDLTLACYHLFARYQASDDEISLMVDAAGEVTDTVPATPYDSDGIFHVGGTLGGGYVEGRIDLLQIWSDRRLEDEDASALYNGGSGVACP